MRKGQQSLSHKQCEALAGQIYAQLCEEHGEPRPQGLLTHSFWEMWQLDQIDGVIPQPKDWKDIPYSGVAGKPPRRPDRPSPR